MNDVRSISDLVPDEKNANKGTERGMAQLEDSLRQLGAGRSILVDREGRVIAGNKTLEKAAEIGLEEVVVVQTDGDRLVAVQRMDLDLASDPKARKLAYADNRISETDLDWDLEQVLQDVGNIDMSDLWSNNEIELMRLSLETPDVEFFDDYETSEKYSFKIECDDAEELGRIQQLLNAPGKTKASGKDILQWSSIDR